MVAIDAESTETETETPTLRTMADNVDDRKGYIQEKMKRPFKLQLIRWFDLNAVVVFEIFILLIWTFFFSSTLCVVLFCFPFLLLALFFMRRTFNGQIFIAYIYVSRGHNEMVKSIHFEMNETIQQNKTLYLMVCIHYQWNEERTISLMHVCSIGWWFHTVGEEKKTYKNIAI